MSITIKTNIPLTFSGKVFKGDIVLHVYGTNRRPALIFAANGERISVLTVNVRDDVWRLLPSRAIVIKNWSENEGIFEQLIQHRDLFKETNLYVNFDYTQGPVLLLQPTIFEQYKELTPHEGAK